MPKNDPKRVINMPGKILITALYIPVRNWTSLKFSYIYLKEYYDKKYTLEEN